MLHMIWHANKHAWLDFYSWKNSISFSLNYNQCHHLNKLNLFYTDNVLSCFVLFCFGFISGGGGECGGWDWSWPFQKTKLGETLLQILITSPDVKMIHNHFVVLDWHCWKYHLLYINFEFIIEFYIVWPKS